MDGGGAEQVGARRAALRDGRPQRADLRRGFVRGETGGDVAGLLSVLVKSKWTTGVEMVIVERWFCRGSGMSISGERVC